MKRTTTIVALAALAAGIMVAATTRPISRALARQRVAQALNLSDAQKAQAKAIFREARETAAPLRAELKQDREALRAAAKSADTTRIESLSAAEGQVLGKLQAARTEATAKFYQVLTPEQKAKVDQLRQNRKQHRAKG